MLSSDNGATELNSKSTTPKISPRTSPRSSGRSGSRSRPWGTIGSISGGRVDGRPVMRRGALDVVFHLLPPVTGGNVVDRSVSDQGSAHSRNRRGVYQETERTINGEVAAVAAANPYGAPPALPEHAVRGIGSTARGAWCDPRHTGTSNGAGRRPRARSSPLAFDRAHRARCAIDSIPLRARS